jgi:hypothetical protein
VGRRIKRLARRLPEVAFGIFPEVLQATLRAEVVRLAFVFVGAGGVLGVDLHAADRIDLQENLLSLDHFRAGIGEA